MKRWNQQSESIRQVKCETKLILLVILKIGCQSAHNAWVFLMQQLKNVQIWNPWRNQFNLVTDGPISSIFYLISTFSIEKFNFSLSKKNLLMHHTHTVMMRSEYYYIIYSVFPSLNWTQACLILNSIIIIKYVWLSDVSKSTIGPHKKWTFKKIICCN